MEGVPSLTITLMFTIRKVSITGILLFEKKRRKINNDNVVQLIQIVKKSV